MSWPASGGGGSAQGWRRLASPPVAADWADAQDYEAPAENRALPLTGRTNDFDGAGAIRIQVNGNAGPLIFSGLLKDMGGDEFIVTLGARVQFQKQGFADEARIQVVVVDGAFGSIDLAHQCIGAGLEWSGGAVFSVTTNAPNWDNDGALISASGPTFLYDGAFDLVVQRAAGGVIRRWIAPPNGSWRYLGETSLNEGDNALLGIHVTAGNGGEYALGETYDTICQVVVDFADWCDTATLAQLGVVEPVA